MSTKKNDGNSEELITSEELGRSIATMNTKELRKLILARTLKQKLKADNMKVGELADKLGKSPSEISRWLSGTHNFTLDTLFDIEDKLGVKLINIDVPYKDVTNGTKTFNVNVIKPAPEKLYSNLVLSMTEQDLSNITE